jgi:hypothetical protein
MRCNPREEEQRWCQWNSQIAMMSAGKDRTDKGILEQFESLVQPTQFLEHLRKTMPMSESQLDMVTSMHDVMYRRLNTLEVLFKGGQRAVDEYTNSILVGDNKKKAAALFKAKSKDGPPSKKWARRGGGGSAPNQGSGTNAPQAQNLNQNRLPPIKCGKCNRLGHKTEDCRIGA